MVSLRKFPLLMILIHDECNKTVGAIRRNVLDLNSALSNLSIRVKTYIGDNFSGVRRRLNSTGSKLCKNAIS